MEFKALPVTEEAKRFKEHLRLPGNKRIILSGIFGMGKTYFVDEFFNIYEDDYIQIRINPVNYSVSQNQDIFELIKYDIAFQLLGQDIDFETLEFNTRIFAEYYLVENYKKIVADLAGALSKIDQRLDAIVSPALTLSKRIKEEKKKIESDEKEELKEFLETFWNQAGSIREENDVTVLINRLVDGLREKHPEKKIVLVIDDLDRIDPEHIFRILNIFSAHFDFTEGKNKFDVDKVVLICDVDNIRGIFHNKYGTDIDFTGYIDKFYSTEIFYYEFRNVLVNHIGNFLESIDTQDHFIKNQISSKEPYLYPRDEISFILHYFILANGLNMRVLVNFLKKDHQWERYSVKFRHYSSVYSSSTPILLVLDIITRIIGGEEAFLHTLDKTIARFPEVRFEAYTTWWQPRIGNLLMLIESNQTELKPSKDIEKFIDDKLNIKASYKIENSPRDYGVMGKVVEIGFMSTDLTWDANLRQPDEQLKVSEIPYFQLLKKAFLAQRKLNKIK